MNKKIIWIIVIVLIIIAIFSKIFTNDTNTEEFKPLEKNIGDEFTEISYPNKMFIINYEIADITGDGDKDMVFLIGENSEGTDMTNNVITNMDVVLYDVANGTFIKAGARKLNGKNNKIITSDFTGNGTQDVMIISEEAGRKSIRIYTYEDSKLKEIWKERNNKGLVFDGEFIDGFKVQLVNKKLNIDKAIDVSSNEEEYKNNSFYNASGKLLSENKSVTTTPFCTLEVVSLNDRSGVKTTQRIYGINENDIIDEITVVWKYQDGKWQIVEAKGIKLGNLLY